MKRAFRLPGGRDRIDRELDDELHFHLEGRIEELMEREHLSREDAEREAKRRFGDYHAYRREAHDIDNVMLHRRNRMELFEAIRRESAHAARALLRAPSFSLIAIVTLALGLGAATTIFTVLDRVVIRPLPYPNPDRLVQITTIWPKLNAGEEYAMSKGQYFYFKKNSTVLADLLMYDGGMDVVLADGSHAAERVPTIEVSASAFPLLGIRPEKGRLFTREQELTKDGQAGVALISHGFWVRHFGANPNIIGTRLQLAEQSVEVIGVLPLGASMPDENPDIWMRNHLDPGDEVINNHTHRAIGLLKPGVTIAAAQADFQRVQQRMIEEYPGAYTPAFLTKTGFTIHVRSLRDQVLGPTLVRALWLTFAAVAFVLLIAAANVANLFLVRIEARRREVAVRTALGANRQHLAVYYLAESVMLSLVAAVAAIGVAYALLHVVLVIAPQSLPRLESVQLGWASAVFCSIAALVFGIVFGVMPLTSTTAGDVALLRDGGRGLTTSKSRELLRSGLVLTQVALAVVLLSGAGLMVKTFANLKGVRPGFDPRGVETMSVLLPRDYQLPEQYEPLWRKLIERVDAIPGVKSAGGIAGLPLSGSVGCSGLSVDVAGPTGEKGNCMPWLAVTPGYFETMSIPVQGQLPTWSAVEAGTAPTIVASAFAKRYWGDEPAIGHAIITSSRLPSYPIVGVAGDVRHAGVQEPPIQAVYFPIVPVVGKGGWIAPNTLVIKAPTLGTAAVTRHVRAILAELEPNALVEDVEPMESLVAKSMSQTSFTMLLLLISAGIALALSAVGIYGVISYLVSQRRSEIGIRMALGAQVGEVAGLVIRQSLRLAIIGSAVGVVAALLGTRLLKSLLFDVNATDPFVLGGTVVVLISIAALASLGPARRAAKIDPVEAMRS